MRTRTRIWLAVFLAACGESTAPEILGRFDQDATVGTEVVVELRATYASGRRVSFSFDSESIGIRQRGEILPLGDSSALFRWMPHAEDVGTWYVDIQATDGKNQITETITLRVRATGDGVPVFRRPLGVGSVLDLEREACLRLDVIVDDDDTTDVMITMEEPLLPGSSLTHTGQGEARWEYCPDKSDVDTLTRRMFALSASDGVHEKVIKQFLVLVKPARVYERIKMGGWVLQEQKSKCAFLFPANLRVPRGGVMIISRNASELAFREHWVGDGKKAFPESVSFWDNRDGCFRLTDRRENYFLFDNEGNRADGPTLEVPVGKNLQRVFPSGAAGDFTSWSQGTPDSASPGDRAVEWAQTGRPYVSEISDVAIGDDVGFQFIEITIE